jgi:hypothetical protein
MNPITQFGQQSRRLAKSTQGASKPHALYSPVRILRVVEHLFGAP